MGQVLDITAVAGDQRNKKFFSTTSIVGTAIATKVDADGEEALESFIVINNGQARTSTTNSNVSILVDFIKLTNTVVGNGDDSKIVWLMDTQNAWTSGGTSLTTRAASQFVDTTSSFSRITSAAVIHVGDIVSPTASANVGHLGVSSFRSTVGAIPAIVGDQFITQFGGGFTANSQQSTVQAGKYVDISSPCVLGPGTSLIGKFISGAATTACSFDVEIGWTELHHDFNA